MASKPTPPLTRFLTSPLESRRLGRTDATKPVNIIESEGRSIHAPLIRNREKPNAFGVKCRDLCGYDVGFRWGIEWVCRHVVFQAYLAPLRLLFAFRSTQPTGPETAKLTPMARLRERPYRVWGKHSITDNVSRTCIYNWIPVRQMVNKMPKKMSMPLIPLKTFAFV